METVTVAIVDGHVDGYLTTSELANKTGVSPGTIRQMVHRGQLTPVVIDYGHERLLLFEKTTEVPIRKHGRPHKIIEGG